MGVKRWLAAGGVATALLMTGLAQLGAGPGAAQDEGCGLGLPPGAPGFAEAQARDEALLREQGYLRVCEAKLERYRVKLGSLRGSIAGLAFPPVALDNTPFAQMKSLGGASERVGEVESRLYRGFRMTGGQTLILFEHDMSADGSNASRDPELEQERIKGRPARLIALQAASGKAMSVLSWFEGRRYYELWLDANVAKTPLRDELLALAASLPPSVPGCPNEPPPRPVKRDKDGMPVFDDMPSVITNAEMQAMLAKRPCQ